MFIYLKKKWDECSNIFFLELNLHTIFFFLEPYLSRYGHLGSKLLILVILYF